MSHIYKPRSAVAVAVTVAVGSDDCDQFLTVKTATDFVLSRHTYVHNVEQYFYQTPLCGCGLGAGAEVRCGCGQILNRTPSAIFLEFLHAFVNRLKTCTHQK